MTNSLKYIAITAIAGFTFASCGSDDNSSSTDDDGSLAIDQAEVLDTYASLVFQNYQDAMTDAVALEGVINAFVADPTEVNFEAAKTAWLTARESYGPSEAFRFSSGPIDDEIDGPEGLLNAWPLDENYVDYVEDAPNSGIINDPVTFPDLDKATLESLNEGSNQPENISVGFHAIEFLLWGQDLTDPSENLAGQRPYTDFVDGGTASNQDRRREYLAACADLLTDHLQLMIDEWEVGGPYRTEFAGLDEDEALANILTGIATLSKSELAGERMFVALTNRDQEDEHSCFSDNTNRDIRLNLDGIVNVFRGSYSSVNGPSLEDLITEANPTLGAEITAQVQVAIDAVDATGEPFDLAISDDDQRPAVTTAILALQDLGDLFVEGAAALGLSINAG